MTLTSAANTFRTVIRFGWLIIFVPIIVRIILGIVTATSPPPPPPPPTFTATYGKLPPLVLENVDATAPDPIMRLDLIDADFPVSPPVVGVYPILSAPYGFLSRDRARELGKKLGFLEEPRIIENREMLWQSDLRTLRMNISNLNFIYTYNYLEDPTVFQRSFLGDESHAPGYSDAVLEQLEILGGERGPDLKEGQNATQLFLFDGSKLVDSTSIIQTSAARVDYFRVPIGDIAMVSPQYYTSNVHVTFAKVTLEINYTYWEIDRTLTATYPIKTAQEAYAEFEQNVSQYLVFLGEANTPLRTYEKNEVTQIITREASLGYYDTATYQQYLQPVWVFKGRAVIDVGQQVDFVAYVPAVQSTWLQ
jgi:hypothetical protein